MKYSYDDLAGMIDHSLLHPTLTDDDLVAGCRLAARYRVASVCIKPYAVKLAKKYLKGSGVAVGAVVGFPHGGSATAIKRLETQAACRDGATEIDMVVNIGKVLSGDWAYVKKDIQAVVQEAHRRGAIVKVIFENDFIPDDKIKKKLCLICARVKADFVKTSTGYGFVKGPDGRYGYLGATDRDLELMVKHSPPSVQVKAAGGIRELNDLIRCRDFGVTRVGATATAAMLEEYQKRANGRGTRRAGTSWSAGPGY